MDSISKRRRLTKLRESEVEIDRISNLPSSLIGHILSFLPTKFAVRTSILSSNWKLNWTSITNIDIDDGIRFCKYSNTSVVQMSSFVNFVYRVLLLCRVEHLHKFRLKYNQKIDISLVNSWVAAALIRNVDEFDLFIYVKESGFVSSELLNCRNLVVLKLGEEFVLNVSNAVYLHSLKIMHLHRIEFLNDESFSRLFQGCPLLEELRIEGHVGVNVRVVNIYAPLLKSLVIKNLCCDGDVFYYTEVFDYKIVLDIPSLQYLECNDFMAASYSVQKLQHLVKAVVYLEVSDEQHVSNEAVIAFLEAISKVQVLHVHGYFFQVLERCNLDLPMLCHVTCLEVELDEDLDSAMQIVLLESLPRLETLVFKKVYVPIDWDTCHDVPPCLLFSLKVIQMNVTDEYDELQTVEYFLKNARVLKKLTIKCCFRNQNKVLELTKKLLMLPRASSRCQVEVL